MNFRIIAGISIILMIAWNYFANSGLIYDNNIGDISAKWTTLFTPAGFTFSIWGLIYLAVGVFAFQLLFGLANTKSISINTLKFIILQSIYNSLWIHAFLNEWLWLSTIFLLLLCLSNFIIILNDNEFKPWQKHAWAIYAGWTLVATFANFSIAFVGSGVPADSELTYRLVCVLAAVASAIIAVKIKRFVILFSVSWGLVGIALNHYGSPGLYYPAMLSAFFLFLFTINRLIKSSGIQGSK